MAARIKTLIIAGTLAGIALAAAAQASAEPSTVSKDDGWNRIGVGGGYNSRIVVTGEYLPSAMPVIIRPPDVVARPQTTAG